ncbi:HilA/EilA family virulence transcriptional regulator [Serratia proteamaculans]|nr:HilA/EilA family virulence transcriptional regulator [Serratia proteamaculans]
MNQQYVFGCFILHADGTLISNEQQVHVPPKELAVLTLLLDAAGKLVGKDELLDKVWGASDVNEESLTRCIYALRRILLESKHCRYIDTVYGRGYRFSCPVAVVTERKVDIPRCSIAVLPFQNQSPLNVAGLHHTLVQSLLQYSPFGLVVLPATLTQNCQDLADIVTLVKDLNPDYYLAGKIFPSGDGWKITIELVRADGHHLINKESVDICPLRPNIKLHNQLASMLTRYIPMLRWDPGHTNQLGSMDTAISYLNARHELRLHTTASLRRALAMLQQCIAGGAEYAQPYCSLAECYLAMSQLGIFDQQQALAQARLAANKAIELAPDNPQALGMLALLSCMYSEHAVAKALFKQAWLLAPDSTELYYYQAWALFLNGDLFQAQQLLNECLARDPSYIAAGLLNIWLTYYNSRLDDAITMSQQQLCQYGQGNTVLQSFQALLLAIKGEYQQAEQLVQTVKASGEDGGLITVNICYAEYCLNGDSALPMLQTFLANVDSRYVRASLAPLILVVDGPDAALAFLRQLQDDGYHWLNAWQHDPRLSALVNAISDKNSSVGA